MNMKHAIRKVKYCVGYFLKYLVISTLCVMEHYYY